MLWIAALAVSVLGSSAAIAQNMTLTGSDLKEADTIVNEQVFQGLRLRRRQRLSGFELEWRAERDQKLRRQHLRSGTRRPAAGGGTGLCLIFRRARRRCPRAPAT
jgi:hypothetical protein